MLKHSPKIYRFLRKIFYLPSRATLNNMLKKADIKPGFDSKLFQYLTEVADKLQPIVTNIVI